MSVLKLLEKRNLAENGEDSSDPESILAQEEDLDVSEGEGGEEEKEESAFKEAETKQWKNRARVLVCCGRGSAPGFKGMVRDILDLLPHSQKEVRI